MKQAPAGYSLIELLVAMSLFAIASLGAAQLILGSTKMVSANELASEAVAVAQKKLEDLRTTPFADMVEAAGDCGSDPIPSSRGGVDFTVVCSVTEDESAGVNEVTVTVAWNDHGEEHTYEAHSIFTQVAPNL